MNAHLQVRDQKQRINKTGTILFIALSLGNLQCPGWGLLTGTCSTLIRKTSDFSISPRTLFPSSFIMADIDLLNHKDIQVVHERESGFEKLPTRVFYPLMQWVAHQEMKKAAPGVIITSVNPQPLLSPRSYFLALLRTSLGLTAIRVYDRYTCDLVLCLRHPCNEDGRRRKERRRGDL